MGPLRELKSQDKLPPWNLKGQANWESPSKTQDLDRFCVKGLVLLFSRLVLSDSATPWPAARQASLSFTISQSLLKLTSIELVMPFNHLLCYPLLLLPWIFPSIRIFSDESALRIRWPKYWSFSFSISPSSEYSELISFRIDWFDFRQSKGLSRVFSNSIVQKHQFSSIQLSLWFLFLNNYIFNELIWRLYKLLVVSFEFIFNS